jgi:glucokinase
MKNNKHIVGIDIGGSHTTIGWVNEEGVVVKKIDFSLKPYVHIDDFILKIRQEITSSPLTCQGIGIGAPNGNYFTGMIEFAPNLPWSGKINLCGLLNSYFPEIPIYITNDANAAAMGEYRYGWGKENTLEDFIMITLGTGLGSGIFIKGEIVYGHDGFAGEIGHMIVDPTGRLCGCGRKGCLERYASATGLELTSLEFLNKKRISPDWFENPVQPKAKEVYVAAMANDPGALEIFDYTAKILATGLANAVCFSSPKKIILFGGLAKAGEILIQPLQKYFEEALLQIYKNKVEIMVSKLEENNAAVLGAAALIYEAMSK